MSSYMLIGFLLLAQPVEMRRTGIGIDFHGALKLCSVESWIDSKAKVGTALELANADEDKKVRIVMMRWVPAKSMAQAVKDMTRRNFPAPAFAEEVAAMDAFLRGSSWKRGQMIEVLYRKGKGIMVTAGGRKLEIDSVEYGKAFWHNYLGKFNAGEELKADLVKELKK